MLAIVACQRELGRKLSMKAPSLTTFAAAVLIAFAATGVPACSGADGPSNESPVAPSPSPSPAPAPAPPTFPQPPRGGLLAKLDCSPGDFPNCGWGAWGADDGNYSATLMPGQGPQRQDAVEFTQRPGPLRQYYMGWGVPGNGDEPPGTIRFIRVRIWIPGSAGSLSGYHGGWESKFIILGDGSNALGRVICNLRDNGRSIDTMSIECQRNIDGGDHSTGLLPLTLGTWHSIQIEARSGSAASIAIWIDNNDYNRPTGRTTGNFSLDTTNWRFVGVGFYVNVPRPSNQSLVALRIADDVEFGTGFDPTWHQ